jgi:small subunit ribosomal protein S6
MPLYEHVYLARQDITTQQVEAITQSIEELIKKEGGKIDKIEYWGLRQLAYKIKKNRKAHYTLMNINAPVNALNEVERQISLNEDILRHLTIKVDEFDDGPSVMMEHKNHDSKE